LSRFIREPPRGVVTYSLFDNGKRFPAVSLTITNVPRVLGGNVVRRMPTPTQSCCLPAAAIARITDGSYSPVACKAMIFLHENDRSHSMALGSPCSRAPIASRTAPGLVRIHRRTRQVSFTDSNNKPLGRQVQPLILRNGADVARPKFP